MEKSAARDACFPSFPTIPIPTSAAWKEGEQAMGQGGGGREGVREWQRQGMRGQINDQQRQKTAVDKTAE